MGQLAGAIRSRFEGCPEAHGYGKDSSLQRVASSKSIFINQKNIAQAAQSSLQKFLEECLNLSLFFCLCVILTGLAKSGTDHAWYLILAKVLHG